MIKPEEITIGTKLVHNYLGDIIVLGIAPHCGDYMITIKNSWVYLKNCKI